MKKISYCTQIKDRLWQLAITLPDNLKALKPDEEMVIVNYGSSDGLNRYLKSLSIAKKYMEEGSLIYADIRNCGDYHVPKAKNIAHLLGSGEFVFNLDCDNYVKGFRDLFDKYDESNSIIENSIIHNFSGEYLDGTFGRICLSKNNFLKIGGYNEEFYPIGYEDHDIINRAKHLGIKYIKNKNNIEPPIQNNEDDRRMNNLNQMCFGETDLMNRVISKNNILNEKFIANENKEWGKCNVKINFSNVEYINSNKIKDLV